MPWRVTRAEPRAVRIRLQEFVRNASLEQVRDRLVAIGADIGEIQRLGHDWSLFFRDVDGMELEVCAPA